MTPFMQSGCFICMICSIGAGIIYATATCGFWLKYLKICQTYRKAKPTEVLVLWKTLTNEELTFRVHHNCKMLSQNFAIAIFVMTNFFILF